MTAEEAREELDALCGDIAQLMYDLRQLSYAAKDLIDKLERAAHQEAAQGLASDDATPEAVVAAQEGGK